MKNKISHSALTILMGGYENEITPLTGSVLDWSYKGNLLPLIENDSPRIAIVGTRDLKASDSETIERIVCTLAARDRKPIIISGLAYGTDAVAHRAAINAGLITYAVMPCGLDRIYPSQHKKLAEDIIESGGGLITYFPDGTQPIAINFLERNKVIALMSDEVIIPFSKLHGGAMVTAKFACDYESAEVFAVPGSPNNPNSKGCNRLIAEGMATMIENLEDF